MSAPSRSEVGNTKLDSTLWASAKNCDISSIWFTPMRAEKSVCLSSGMDRIFHVQEGPWRFPRFTPQDRLFANYFCGE